MLKCGLWHKHELSTNTKRGCSIYIHFQSRTRPLSSQDHTDGCKHTARYSTTTTTTTNTSTATISTTTTSTRTSTPSIPPLCIPVVPGSYLDLRPWPLTPTSYPVPFSLILSFDALHPDSVIPLWNAPSPRCIRYHTYALVLCELCTETE